MLYTLTHHNYLFKVFSLLLCFLFVSTVESEELKLTHTKSSEWSFFQTHNAELDPTKVDVSKWKNAEVPSIFIKDPSQGIYIWFKRTFSLDSDQRKSFQNQTSALYLESIRNSDETWLNGVKIGGHGDISPPWDVWQEYPLNLPRVYDLSPNLLKDNNTLLIKINAGIGDIKGTEYFGSVGITGPISLLPKSEAKEKQYKINLKSNNLDILIIALGMIDIFLIIFLFKNTFHNLPEFPWLLINSILMIAATLMLDVFYLNDMKYPVFGFIRYITVFGIPYVTALYFWSQSKNIPKNIVIIFGVIQLAVALTILLPWFPSELKGIAWKTTLILFVTCFIYSIFTAFSNLLKKRAGSLTQVIGLTIYLFSVRTDVFNVDLFNHHNVYIGSLIFRYSILLAYFQRIQEMSASYKVLSKRMLSTIEEKRSEIARELHDGLGQHLASSKFQAQLASVNNDKQHLNNVTKELNSAVSSMHRLIEGLHPMALDKYHLQKAIEHDSKRLETNYPVKIKLDLDDGNIPKETEVHLFRIYQESINNALRHGKASEIDISLKILSNKLILSVKDNGIGIKKHKKDKINKEGGFGMISLKERVNLINGYLQRSSHAKKGTEIIVTIPL